MRSLKNNQLRGETGLDTSLDSISIEHFFKVSNKLIHDVHVLEQEIFDHPLSEMDLRSRLGSQSSLLALVAYSSGAPIAYKVGFAHSEKVFYSWIGGVSQLHRGKGIGKNLILTQHSWALQNGFGSIRTSSRNKYREMMILNLKAGFEIVGTQMSSKDNALSILFEKKL